MRVFLKIWTSLVLLTFLGNSQRDPHRQLECRLCIKIGANARSQQRTRYDIVYSGDSDWRGSPLGITLSMRNNAGVRYPTCLRTEFDLNSISLSARHPDSEIRISITHRLADNPTTRQPVAPTTKPLPMPLDRPHYHFYLSLPHIYDAIRVGFLVIISFYFNFRRFADFLKVLDIISIVTIDYGPLSPLAPDTLYPWILATSRYKNYLVS